MTSTALGHRDLTELGPRPMGAGGDYPEHMLVLVRRVLAALSMAGMLAAFFRLRGTGGVPPRNGGWREVSGPDLR